MIVNTDILTKELINRNRPEILDYTITTARIGKRIVAINDQCFKNCKSLTYVTLLSAENLSSVGCEAFSGAGLHELDINCSTVNVLSAGVFCDCEFLSCIKVPNTITEIQDSAFNGCKLLSSIGNQHLSDYTSLVKIGKNAFAGTSIGYVDFQNTEKMIIDDYAFANCTSLSCIDLQNFNSIENIPEFGISCFGYISAGADFKIVFNSSDIAKRALDIENLLQYSDFFYPKVSYHTSLSIKVNSGLKTKDELGNDVYRFYWPFSMYKAKSVDNSETYSIDFGNGTIIESNVKYNPKYKYCDYTEDDIDKTYVVTIDDMFDEINTSNNLASLSSVYKICEFGPMIAKIGYKAFEHTCIQDITIPNHITELGFLSLNATTLVLDDQHVTIDDGEILNDRWVVLNSSDMFFVKYSDAVIDDLIVPESITNINSRCFSLDANVNKVHIGSQVSYISNTTFIYNYNIIVDIASDNGTYSADNSGKSIFMKGTKELFLGIDNTAIMNDTESILDVAMSDKTATQYLLPTTLTSIGSMAFSNNINLSTFDLTNARSFSLNNTISACISDDWFNGSAKDVEQPEEAEEYIVGTNDITVNCYDGSFVVRAFSDGSDTISVKIL